MSQSQTHIHICAIFISIYTPPGEIAVQTLYTYCDKRVVVSPRANVLVARNPKCRVREREGCFSRALSCSVLCGGAMRHGIWFSKMFAREMVLVALIHKICENSESYTHILDFSTSTKFNVTLHHCTAIFVKNIYTSIMHLLFLVVIQLEKRTVSFVIRR